MPQNHKKYPYIQSLIEKKDIQGLISEKVKVEEVIWNYSKLLSSAINELEKENIMKSIKYEEKLLKYINEALSKLLSSN